MEASEYLKERTRMCDTDGCDRCSFWCDGCQVWYAESHTTEVAISMVEKWSKAHAPKTKREKFEEVFGVEAINLPNPYTTGWWDEPYKEPEHE